MTPEPIARCRAMRCSLGSGIVLHRAVTGYQDLHDALRHLVGQALRARCSAGQASPASAFADAFSLRLSAGALAWGAGERSRSCAVPVANKRVAIRNVATECTARRLRLSLRRMMFSFTSPLKVRLGLKTYCARSLRCSGNGRGTRFLDRGHRVTCCRGT